MIGAIITILVVATAVTALVLYYAEKEHHRNH